MSHATVVKFFKMKERVKITYFTSKHNAVSDSFLQKELHIADTDYFILVSSPSDNKNEQCNS